MEVLKKITMKEIGSADLLAECAKTGKEIVLAHIAGVARGVKTGVSGFGEYHTLQGTFVAKHVNGKEFKAAQLILPALANDLVLSEMQNAGENGVDLAFTIIAKPDTSGRGGTGYKFGAVPLLPPRKNDELAHLTTLLPAIEARPESPVNFEGEKPKLEPAPETRQITSQETPAKPATETIKAETTKPPAAETGHTKPAPPPPANKPGQSARR